jgi:glycosyltransferase involved in cell wall biosynthesis
LACGCPVIASNTSSQPEVAGDAALYINPYDAEGLVKALDEIGKPETRETLRRRGLGRAAEFTWSRSVQALESLLHQIAPTPSIDDR